MSNELNSDRRRFLGVAVMTMAAAHLVTDSAGAQSRKRSAKKFSGKYTHRLLSGGVGHNLPQEAPEAFAAAVIEVDRF